MLILVMMGRWYDDSAHSVVHYVRLYGVLNTVVLFGEHVCCGVEFGTLFGVSAFSVIRSDVICY